jgi:hypothetical protein
MHASSSGRAATFFSASAAALSQEVAGGKMHVQSACALNAVYRLYRHKFKQLLQQSMLF